MNRIALAALVSLFAAMPAFALDPVAKVIDQPEAAVQITSYEAETFEQDSYPWAGVRNRINVKNTSKEQVAATKFGFVSFDAWDELLDTSSHFMMEGMYPADEETRILVARDCDAETFHTGFLYVSKIRFEDGQIWEADMSVILAKIRAFDPDFVIDDLHHDEDSQDGFCG